MSLRNGKTQFSCKCTKCSWRGRRTRPSLKNRCPQCFGWFVKETTKLVTPKWWRVPPDEYRLHESQCYLKTEVRVRCVAYREWIFVIRNCENAPQGDNEISRVPGVVKSSRFWRTKESAQKNAMVARMNRQWLEAAGIKFKD